MPIELLVTTGAVITATVFGVGFLKKSSECDKLKNEDIVKLLAENKEKEDKLSKLDNDIRQIGTLKSEILNLKQEIKAKDGESRENSSLKDEIERLKQAPDIELDNKEFELLRNEIMNLTQIIANQKNASGIIVQENSILKNEIVKLKQIVSTKEDIPEELKMIADAIVPEVEMIASRPIERYRIDESDIFVDNIVIFAKKVKDTSKIDEFLAQNPSNIYMNAFEKYKEIVFDIIDDLDIDNAMTDNLHIIVENLHKNLLLNIMTASYRGKDDFDVGFSQVLVNYLKNLGFYSRNSIKENTTIKAGDYEDMDVIPVQTGDGKSEEIINIELLPYYLKYKNTNGEIDKIFVKGKVYIAKK